MRKRIRVWSLCRSGLSLIGRIDSAVLSAIVLAAGAGTNEAVDPRTVF
jgi:hypothetical protein